MPLGRRRLKVGLVTTSFPTTGNAASGAFIARLASHISALADVSVVTPDSTLPLLPATDELKVQRFRYAPRSWQRIAHQPGGIPVVLRRRPLLFGLLPFFLVSMLLACIGLARRSNIVHANWSINGVVAGLAGLITRTTVVTTLRGSDVERLEHSWLHRLLLLVCFRTNAHIVCVSHAIQGQVEALLPQQRSRVSVIPNGVDERLFAIARDGRPTNTVHLLTIGSLIPRKRTELLINAIRIAKDKVNVDLTIVGDGPERSSIAQLVAAAGLNELVNLVGTVSPSHIARQLELADIFVLASDYEGRSNAMLEAMAAGLPVVATAIPGTLELIEHEVNGLLFRARDTEALALHIIRLASDAQLRERLGRAARRTILDQQLTWQNTAEAYVNLYERLLGFAKT